ncbi:hypothetical protein KVR01_002140 [Diaporthe batatas]|uniref:uncharacterized protein n=1 Tax=Diaporthe batatas TaxID=748121 RepID=UPI001D042BB4|nr:uncharacterized protein KVR01_002140 [Diaporthe batatas]KAG8166451.1 hypothetical protein KVR01_002140 [Diaporthe batatas]
MAMRPGPPRQAVGSTAWFTEERSSALQIAQSEVEEFGYSARNELEWLNEHMADVFSENQINVADVFKTPGKLRGKTPRTVHKPIQNENRVPLSNIFSSTPKGEPNPFTTSALHIDRTPKFRIAEDDPASPPTRPSVARKPVPTKPANREPVAVLDSGYYGSQSQEVTFKSDELVVNAEPVPSQSPQRTLEPQRQSLTAPGESDAIDDLDPNDEIFEDPAEAVNATETKHTRVTSPEAAVDQGFEAEPVPASSPVNLLGPEAHEEPPVQASPLRSEPARPEAPAIDDGGEHSVEGAAPEPAVGDPAEDDEVVDVTRSPSEGSSPIRPPIRKSSLNFASLPAREPMASNKSLGGRVSRISHIDQTRTSFYPRPTGGKSLGIRQEMRGDDHDADAMDIDEDDMAGASSKEITITAHSKTYTQRLQDQISMLGKSQSGGPRLSKSIPSLVGTQKAVPKSQSQVSQTTRVDMEVDQTPPRIQQVTKTPGAFPDDDEDDWIAPPTTIQAAVQSPRPAIAKSYTADVMEGLHGKSTVGDAEQLAVAQHSSQLGRSQSPPHPTAAKSDLAPSTVGHMKSASVDLSNHKYLTGISDSNLRKIVSASNPVSVTTQQNDIDAPPKSPSRTFRESPLKHSALKQVKNKFSSILKNSKGLLASSAAISAEGKASLVNSPSTVRLEKQATTSTDSLRAGKEQEPLYPDLTRHPSWDSQPAPTLSSPSRSGGRRTRASAERDRKEQRQRGREDKEAAHLATQLDKLEKEREKEREKARVFSKEQERIAAEKQLAAQKELEKDVRTPAPRGAPKPTRSSPRKAKTQQADSRAAAKMAEPGIVDQDTEMTDAPTTKVAPPSIPRPTPGSSLRNQEIKRPSRPTTASKPKQAPTLIRVNTSSQNTGFHPSNSILAATLESTLGPSQQQIKGKSSQPTLQTKASQQSFNSSVNSTTGRPKALDLAAKRKQQEEKEAQRRRDAKAEIDRKRAAMREEERRQEQERRDKERQQAAKEEDAKKKARQAAIEKAKQTRAPPPAVRPQPNAAPEYSSVRDKAGLPRPPSRLQHSTAHRSQEDVSRPVNAVLSSTTSMSLKRPLQPDGAEDGTQRPAASRSGQPQQKEVKRMRMSDEFSFEDEAEIQSYGTSLKGPPVRPSAGFKKDLPNKPLYSGYAPAAQGATRDIFKAPVAPQQINKSGHLLDMAQVSKGPIPFASSHHAAGASHKTPARPKSIVATKSAAKPANRSSPRLQNGENIELPEIQTDDDDDDEEEDEGAKATGVASWADTPALRRELMRQETIDPLQVFGPPAPLNMEEVFSKSKDRWQKFRARTSSANWSGADRLTEDEIRKDIAARDRMRREGGWTYELSKDM